MTSPSPEVAPKRFRIALSFAGEKRDYVAQVAAILAQRFGEEAVLYDKYHEAELVRRDTGIYLPELYHKQSDLIVVVICKDYENKEWCGLEWIAIHALLMKRRDDLVMLAHFDRASVPGLYDSAGFVELDRKEPRDFGTLILQRLAINEGKSRDHYLPTASADPAACPNHNSIPHNLPCLQPFFGRKAELAIIAAALHPENHNWGISIEGPGGMGKTSLAIRAAHACAPGSFARIIFVSLKTRVLDDRGERDLSGFILSGLIELFNELARELGKPEISKAAETERPRALLEALRGAKALLILDNLESLTVPDRGTVLAFVTRLPAGCKAILTSRAPAGCATEELTLEELGQAAALQALAELAIRNPELAATTEASRIALYRQTQGNPLLLRWTAGQLGSGHILTIDDAIAFLRSRPAGNDALEFVFGDLMKLFSADELKVAAALTYFTRPARLKHIAPLAEIGDEPCRIAAQSLVNRSLATPAEDLQAFALLPMVADFLRTQQPELVRQTGERLGYRAREVIEQNGHDQHERFPLLDAEWESVAAALPLFLDGPNDQLQELCGALVTFLDFTGRWDERLSLCLQAETRALAAQDLDQAGARAYQAGWVHRSRGQGDEVLACAGRAASHWEHSEARARERITAMRLGAHGYYLKKDYPAALEAFTRALGLDRSRSPDSRDVLVGLNDLAMVEYQLGHYEEAEKCYREALPLAELHRDDEGVALIKCGLAGLARKRQDWLTAVTLASEALQLANKVERLDLTASACNVMADILLSSGDPVKALSHALKAVEIYTRLGSPDLKDALDTLRECEIAMGER